MPTNTLFRNVKESEENIPETIPFSRAVPKVSGVYFGPRSILHSSIVDIHRVVVMLCNPAHKAMDNNTNGHRQKQVGGGNHPSEGGAIHWI